MVIEGTVWAIQELVNEVSPLDAPPDYIWQIVPFGRLPSDVKVVQLQQELAPDSQCSVIAPHSNLHSMT